MAAVAAAMVFASALASAAPQDFDLANNTGYEIKSLYIGPTSSNDWATTSWARTPWRTARR